MFLQNFQCAFYGSQTLVVLVNVSQHAKELHEGNKTSSKCPMIGVFGSNSSSSTGCASTKYSVWIVVTNWTGSWQLINNLTMRLGSC
jgi:hypothetical protein